MLPAPHSKCFLRRSADETALARLCTDMRASFNLFFVMAFDRRVHSFSPHSNLSTPTSHRPHLPEAVETLEGEAPRAATHSVTVGDDIGAEVATAEVLVVEEGHVVSVVCLSSGNSFGFVLGQGLVGMWFVSLARRLFQEILIDVKMGANTD